MSSTLHQPFHTAPGAPPDPPTSVPTDPPLVGYLDGLVERLLSQSAEVLATEQIDAVHQARVATRRLKAALDLVEPLVSNRSRRAMIRVLRRVRRRLGPVRDIDVMIGHLDELAPRPSDATGESRPPSAGAWLTEELEHDRLDAMDQARADRTITRLPQKLRRWAKLRGQVAANAAALDVLIRESLARQSADFATAAGELAAGDATDLRGGESVDPHVVRIAGKALRYTVEMAQAHGHPLPDHIARSFKKMQDALGLWHDHVVLTERALQVSAECMLAHHNLSLQREVLELALQSLSEAGAQLENFKSLWRENGEGLLEAIRAAYPDERVASGDASESRTDHDPSGSPAPSATDGPH